MATTFQLMCVRCDTEFEVEIEGAHEKDGDVTCPPCRHRQAFDDALYNRIDN